MSTVIVGINAWQALNAKGDPTVGATVELAGGAHGSALVPAGTSTGSHEARERRDGDPDSFQGRGVTHAVSHVRGEIAAALVGRRADDQRAVDETLIALDGTDDRSRLGSNALLATSLAVARAAAAASGVPLWRYLGGLTTKPRTPAIPRPMFSLLTGGRHAYDAMPIQDLLVMPIGATSIAEAVAMAHGIWTETRVELGRRRGVSPVVADTGGFRFESDSTEEGLEILSAAARAIGLQPGRDVVFGMDVAANELMVDGRYELDRGARLSADEVVETLARWCERGLVRSIEDPLDEDDWKGWAALTAELGEAVQVIGDDLFVTSLARLERGIEGRAANAVLLKPNQVGTLTETLDVFERAAAAGMEAVLSQRSGETEDSFIADLAVGTGIGQAKFGSLSRAERLAKYNRLLQIAALDGVMSSPLPERLRPAPA